MTDRFRHEVIILPSDFGDTGVRLSRVYPDSPSGVHALLLHGVHSSANLGRHNKFRNLAGLLADRGVTPWLCETSRREAKREDYGENLHRWIEYAFGGKTFQNELDDCASALRRVRCEQPRELWIWGFSLGGIIAVALACSEGAGIKRIILSGTGLVSTPEAEKAMMPLPVLSTLRSTLKEDMLDSFRADEAFAFRGTEDCIFTEEACRSLLDSLDVKGGRKEFFAIEGADHSMKIRGGRYDPGIMEQMLLLMGL